MKKRIGDISFNMVDKICKDQATCATCPLNYQSKCMSYNIRFNDIEVEIDEKYFKDTTNSYLFVDQILKKAKT